MRIYRTSFAGEATSLVACCPYWRSFDSECTERRTTSRHRVRVSAYAIAPN